MRLPTSLSPPPPPTPPPSPVLTSACHFSTAEKLEAAARERANLSNGTGMLAGSFRPLRAFY